MSIIWDKNGRVTIGLTLALASLAFASIREASTHVELHWEMPGEMMQDQFKREQKAKKRRAERAVEKARKDYEDSGMREYDDMVKRERAEAERDWEAKHRDEYSPYN